MTNCTRIVSVFVVVALSACAKVDQGPITGTTGTGGGQSTGTGGTGGGGGSAVVTGTGGDMRGTIGAGGGGGEASCGLERFDLERRPVEILVLLDRSKSMARDSMDKDIPPSTGISKWNQIVPALTEVINSVGGDISWGLKTFPEDGGECANASLTTKVDVPIAEKNAADVTRVVMGTMPNGDGTPTGATFEVATAYLRARANDHRKFILFATDGQPSCAGSVGSLTLTGGGSVPAVGAATTGISAAAQAGFHTFVVGVATKPTDTETLNAWAVAGLKPRSDPNPLATKYYLGATKAELVSVFTTITNVAQTCVFPLSKPPPVPANIAVKVVGVKAPIDSSNTNGWNYTDANHTAVEVFGLWCDMIKSTTAGNRVEIIFGCPNEPIP